MNKRILTDQITYNDKNIPYIRVDNILFKVSGFITASLIPCDSDDNDVLELMKNVSVPVSNEIKDDWTLYLANFKSPTVVDSVENYILNSEQSFICFY